MKRLLYVNIANIIKCVHLSRMSSFLLPSICLFCHIFVKYFVCCFYLFYFSIVFSLSCLFCAIASFFFLLDRPPHSFDAFFNLLLLHLYIITKIYEEKWILGFKFRRSGYPRGIEDQARKASMQVTKLKRFRAANAKTRCFTNS